MQRITRLFIAITISTIATIATSSATFTQLVDPFDVTVAPNGSILVADAGAGALISVDPQTW